MKHGAVLFGNILHYILIFLLIYNRKKKLMKIKEMLKYQCGYILSNCTPLVKNIGIQYLKNKYLVPINKIGGIIMDINRAIELLDYMNETDPEAFKDIVHIKKRELIGQYIEGLDYEDLSKVLKLIVELNNKKK